MQYHTSIVPPQQGLGVKIDKLQRRMVSLAMNNTRLRTEEWVEFVRRSAGQSSRYIEKHSEWWSRLWLTRAISWDDHLARDWSQQKKFWVDNAPSTFLTTSFSGAAALYSWRAQAYMDSVRTFHLRTSLGDRVDGRTGARAKRGKVHARWHEGIAYARRMTL